jgi:hypothetical protein
MGSLGAQAEIRVVYLSTSSKLSIAVSMTRLGLTGAQQVERVACARRMLPAGERGRIPELSYPVRHVAATFQC